MEAKTEALFEIAGRFLREVGSRLESEGAASG